MYDFYCLLLKLFCCEATLYIMGLDILMYEFKFPSQIMRVFLCLLTLAV